MILTGSYGQTIINKRPGGLTRFDGYVWKRTTLVLVLHN